MWRKVCRGESDKYSVAFVYGMTLKLRLNGRGMTLDLECASVEELQGVIQALIEKGIVPAPGASPAISPSLVAATQGSTSEPISAMAVPIESDLRPKVGQFALDDPIGQFMRKDRRDGVWVATGHLPPKQGDEKRLADTALLLMYAYEVETALPVSAINLRRSLGLTGFNLGDRLDRPLGEYEHQGLFVTGGRGKGRTYRLTERGKQRALECARELANMFGGVSPTPVQDSVNGGQA